MTTHVFRDAASLSSGDQIEIGHGFQPSDAMLPAPGSRATGGRPRRQHLDSVVGSKRTEVPVSGDGAGGVARKSAFEELVIVGDVAGNSEAGYRSGLN